METFLDNFLGICRHFQQTFLSNTTGYVLPMIVNFVASVVDRVYIMKEIISNVHFCSFGTRIEYSPHMIFKNTYVRYFSGSK